LDIYEELKKDHREIKMMLNELVGLDKDDDFRFLLISQIRSALLSHSRAEEAVLYNSLRTADGEPYKIGMKGYKEHFEIEALLRGLQFMDRVDANWKPMARKLKELLSSHLSNEEKEVFTLCKLMFNPVQAERMGRAFRELKNQVEQEGDAKTTMDMMVNLLPPKYSLKLMNNLKSLSP
tara:strand:+ start:21340 stop:21876 length:537 start_codon:yes stop_codon:yes gene_type:complete